MVRVLEMDIADFQEDFDVGISLHACGGATDVSLQKCLEQRAAFVMAPCCLGKILQQRSSPLSRQFQTILCPPCKKGKGEGKGGEKGKGNASLFTSLIRSGDFGHGSEVAKHGEEEERGRRLSKSLVEDDRRRLAMEYGYVTGLVTMFPTFASAKNDMILGMPTGTSTSGGDGGDEDNGDFERIFCMSRCRP
jgi:hypothetical protein